MKMRELIPSLKKLNIKVQSISTMELNPDQMHTVFHIINEIADHQPETDMLLHGEWSRYRQSFLKQRLLHGWRKIRMAFYLERLAPHDAYAELAGLFEACFHEEYHEVGLEMNIFTLRAFLWNQEHLTEKMGAHRDRQGWVELLDLLDALEQAGYE
ncbi:MULTISPECIES: hypothetical protein [Laceyella]|jgi:hypothetical protein|uniref:Uncharacterized protein n=2 Tax=Laceyella TaxID=292635 RepID=A0ABY5U0J4_LACSH|nr:MULTISPECIES: hypothetical protein [Laceyella]PRZ14730.1 hypothetical protein CLV36_10543 [Laceyella sediminis]TCW38804.1 hypothetical protein EDC32_10241 [Laceyella sacchari]UWE03144.1 hypothetical protein NYR52_13650 [Laceyella sacchari]